MSPSPVMWTPTTTFTTASMATARRRNNTGCGGLRRQNPPHPRHAPQSISAISSPPSIPPKRDPTAPPRQNHPQNPRNETPSPPAPPYYSANAQSNAKHRPNPPATHAFLPTPAPGSPQNAE